MPRTTRRRVVAVATLVSLSVSGMVALPAAAATTTVTTWEELQAAFAATTGEGTIALGDDITAPDGESLAVVADAVLTLDLASHALEIWAPVDGAAGIAVPPGSSLTIDGEATGSLAAYGGQLAAGIGGGDGETAGSITVADGTIVAWGGFFAAGVGGGAGADGGTVVVTDGALEARGGRGGAGIGGGYSGEGGSFSASGGTTTATGGSRGSGIGGGEVAAGGTVTITNGSVTANGGFSAAGIGGGSGARGGTTTVSGGTVIATGNENGAGIGGGLDGNGVSSSISGGTVTANGGRYGAGIGGGYRGNGGTIAISGGIVAATGGEASAGVGGGFLGLGGSTSITGGGVDAEGDSLGAGIGGGAAVGGYAGFEGLLAITGTAVNGSATTGSGVHGSPITNPTQPAGVRYLAVASTVADRSSFSLDYVAIVSFDTTGGSTIADAVVPIGSPLSEPTSPTRSGFSFAGWELGSEPYDFGSPVSGSLTLSATWTPLDVYRVSFDSAGGSAVADQEVYDGEPATTPPAPTRNGFVFAGWTLSGEPYTFSTPVTGPITLTATWTIATYRVTFDSAGGSSVPPQDIAAGSPAAAPADPTRDGFVFAGWTLTGEPYTFSTPVTATITLVATWTELVAPEPTTRLFGADRYATAVRVSEVVFADGASTVFIATGTGFADALSAAPAAASVNAPLLLTPPSSLPSSVRKELIRLDPTTIVIVGGPGAVSRAVEAALRSLPGAPAVERLEGADRFATSRAIASTYFASATDVFLATGRNFPDALAAGPAAAHRGAPVILVDGGQPRIDAGTIALIDALGASVITIAGGTGAVSIGIENQLDARPGLTVERLSGANRYATAVVINDAVFGASPTIYVATGLGFADALAGGAAAASSGAPLYITTPGCVPRDVLDSMQRRSSPTVIFLGGPSVLSSAVELLRPC